jgi:AraC family transcriptional activator of pobA
MVIAASPAIIATVEALADEHGSREDLRPVMLRALALELMCLVARALPAAPDPSVPNSNQRFRDFETMVAQNLRKGWRLDDYARALGLSARHLGRLCHAARGIPAATYIEAARLGEARRLLVYTRASVAEIGYQLGFDDPSYFSRAFRRHTGQTPRDYRAAFDKE